MDKIERLRALEKAVELVAKATPGPWQQVGSTHSYGIGGDFTPGAFSLVAGGTSGKDCDAVVAAVNFIREHGSALIAELGQEVGAVSFAEWFRDACSATDFDANNGDAAAATNRSYARQAWCAAMTSSPAHTSEARDALLIAGGKLRAAMEMQEGRELETLHISQPTAKFLWDNAKKEWDDAAMRQEGGTP